MRVKVKIWYPEHHTVRTECVIEMPDGKNPKDYIYEHFSEILINNGAEDIDWSNALDVGYAGVKLIKEII
jgi:hypothetical protein